MRDHRQVVQTMRAKLDAVAAQHAAESAAKSPAAGSAEYWQAKFREEIMCRNDLLDGLPTDGYPPDVVAEVTRFLEAIALLRARERHGRDSNGCWSDEVWYAVRGTPAVQARLEVERRSYRLTARDVPLSIAQLVEVQLRRLVPDTWVRRPEDTCEADAHAATEALSSMLREQGADDAWIRDTVPHLARLFGPAAARLCWADICVLLHSDADIDEAYRAVYERLGLLSADGGGQVRERGREASSCGT